MFKCDKCEEIFEEPKLIKEHHTECEGQPYEIFAACPCCGCLRIEEKEN